MREGVKEEEDKGRVNVRNSDVESVNKKYKKDEDKERKKLESKRIVVESLNNKRKKEEEKDKQSTKRSEKKERSNEQMTVKISSANSDRDVKVTESKSDEKKPIEDTKKRQSPLELLVVEGRRTLSGSLFKLSAHMSQLRKESHGVESGLRYAAELRRQLQETEDLVRLRQDSVQRLRESIRRQHEQIVTEREAMVGMEESCRAVGIAVPEEGAENIQKKLAQIKNTAMEVKTTAYSDGTEEKVEAEDETIKAQTVPDKIIDCASPVKAQVPPQFGRDGIPEGAGGGPVDPLPAQVGSGGAVGDSCSPLEHLNLGGRRALDPHRPLCRFHLAGKCLDSGCPDQHTD